MRKHSFLRGLTAFTLAGLLAFYSGVVQLPNVSAESITDLKSQLAELEKQEEENNKRLEELRDALAETGGVEITLDEPTRRKAKICIDRMLQYGG